MVSGEVARDEEVSLVATERLPASAGRIEPPQSGLGHLDQPRGRRRLAFADFASIRLFGGLFLPLDGLAGREAT